MTTPHKLPADLIRLLLVTPRRELWDTVRPMASSYDDAMAVLGVTVLAQCSVDARVVLAGLDVTPEIRAFHVEAAIKDLLR